MKMQHVQSRMSCANRETVCVEYVSGQFDRDALTELSLHIMLNLPNRGEPQTDTRLNYPLPSLSSQMNYG